MIFENLAASVQRPACKIEVNIAAFKVALVLAHRTSHFFSEVNWVE
jgi:hypothetical protein